METAYKYIDGRRLFLYDEGNRIVVSLVGTGRNIQWGVVCRDYQSNLTSFQLGEEIFVAYVNLENNLCFTRVFDAESITLALEETVGVISDVQMVYIQGEKSELYVAYRNQNPKKDYNCICVINPLGERKNQILIREKDRIEGFDFLLINGESCLVYRVSSNPYVTIMAIDLNRLGDISLTKKILCKEQTMEELTKRCKETDKDFQKALKDKEKEYEKRLMETVKTIEKRYKEQYDELAKLAKGMQEEGIKWRKLYYENVTKN